MRSLFELISQAKKKLREDDPTSRGGLTQAEKQLLDKVAAGRPVMALVRTGTTVDVGEWFRRGRVVAVCLNGEWVMFAPGLRPFVEKVETRLLTASSYNQIVGELVLVPAHGAQLRQLKMSPLEAGRALRSILNVSDEAAN